MGNDQSGSRKTEIKQNVDAAPVTGMLPARNSLFNRKLNLLLKATELGLGTLVMGIRDAGKLKEVFEIPEEEIVVSVIGVGYADVDPEMPKRKSVDETAKFY